MVSILRFSKVGKIGGVSQRDKVIEINQVGNDFVGKPNNGRTKEHRWADCIVSKEEAQMDWRLVRSGVQPQVTAMQSISLRAQELSQP